MLRNVIDGLAKLIHVHQQSNQNASRNYTSHNNDTIKQEQQVKMPTLPTFRVTNGTTHRINNPVDSTGLLIHIPFE